MIDLPKTRCPRLRSGAVTLEAILGVLVLVIAFVAVLQFGINTTIRHSVIHAASVAAREAGKGASITELETVVENVLVPHNITIGPSAAILLEDPDVGAIPPIGSLTCTAPSTPVVVSGDVRVTVCVRMDTKPFVNWLLSFGVDVSDRCIRASSIVRKELP